MSDGKEVKFSKNCKMKICKGSWTWLLEEFCTFQEKFKYYVLTRRCEFDTRQKDSTEWSWKMYLNDANVVYFSLNASNVNENFLALLKLHFIKADEEKHLIYDGEKEMSSSAASFVLDSGIEIDEFARKGFVNNNILKIHFEIEETHFLKSEENEELMLDVGSLLGKGLVSDVVLLKCKGQAIKIHSEILKERAPVLHASLTGKMKELIITDMKFDVLKEFVVYLYSNHISEYSKNTTLLLVVADRYGIEPLKNALEKKLSENINLDNFVELLSFSKLYKLNHIKEAIIEFIGKINSDQSE